MHIAVIGSGAWGTALGIHFAKFFPTTLVTRTKKSKEELNKARENERYLPHIAFPENLGVAHLEELPGLKDLALIIIATPVAGVRSVLKAYPVCAATPLLIAAKGFERGTGLLPHQIAEELYPEHRPIGLLSGPTFAQELAQGLPCAICLATTMSSWGAKTAGLLNTHIMRVYVNADPIGVGVGGAIKNIIAIATGFSDGRHTGQNARAALITRGLAEMTRLALALGGKKDTMRGLGALGDLILTATGTLSRNRQVGLKLAEGESLDKILKDLGHVAEGINTLDEVLSVAGKLKVDMPIAEMLAAVVGGKISADEVLEIIMSRAPKSETT